MPWKENCQVELRHMLVMAMLRGEASVSDLCVEAGISRKTAYKWLDRYDKGGRPAMADASRAPRTRADAIGDEFKAALLEQRRRHPTWGPKKLLAVLDRDQPELPLCSLASAGRILKESGLSQPQTRRRYASKGRVGGRIEARAANDVWTADFKGQFMLGDRTLCYPLTIADAFSRYLLCVEGKTSVRTEPVRASFERTFREYGIPRVIRSDNGAPFAGVGLGGLTVLSVWWLTLGIELDRITPGRPSENGSHERMHRTLKAETARPPGRDAAEQQAKFDRFRREYVEERPHEALGQRTPGALYASSVRPYRAAEKDDDYPGHWQRRKVQERGTIYWRKQHVFLSEPLGGRAVGLVEIAEDVWRVYFRTKLLGILDDRGEQARIRAPLCVPDGGDLEGETRPLSPSSPTPLPPSRTTSE